MYTPEEKLPRSRLISRWSIIKSLRSTARPETSKIVNRTLSSASTETRIRLRSAVGPGTTRTSKLARSRPASNSSTAVINDRDCPGSSKSVDKAWIRAYLQKKHQTSKQGWNTQTPLQFQRKMLHHQPRAFTREYLSQMQDEQNLARNRTRVSSTVHQNERRHL